MNDIIMKDDNGLPVCKVSYNIETQAIDVKINKPINLIVNGDIGTEINGEFDLTVCGDMRIDTFLAKLFINSYMSKHIKDHPHAIEKRKEIDIRTKNYEEWMGVNEEKMIEFAKAYLVDRGL